MGPTNQIMYVNKEPIGDLHCLALLIPSIREITFY